MMTMINNNPGLLNSLILQFQSQQQQQQQQSTPSGLAPVSGFMNYGNPMLHPSQQIVPKNKRVVRSKKSWKIMLTDESLAECSIKPAKDINPDFLEFGGTIMTSENSRYKFEFLTPPLKVIFVAVNCVGIKPEDTKDKKANDSDRKYKINLAAECDPELAAEDPSIPADQQAFAARMKGGFKIRIATLLWNAGVKDDKRNRILEAEIELACAKKGIDPKKISDVERRAMEKDPEIVSGAIKKFAAEMGTWESVGDKNKGIQADGDRFILRAKRSVFFPPKAAGDFEEKGTLAKGNKNATRSASQKGVKGQLPTKQTKKLGEAEEEEEGEYANTYESAHDDVMKDILEDEMGGGKNEISHEECERIISSMKARGWKFNRPKYIDCDGDPVELGPGVIDYLPARIIKNGDYVQVMISAWVSSQADAKGRFGVKLQFGQVIQIFRQSNDGEEIRYSDQYKGGKKATILPQNRPVNPALLAIKAPTTTTTTTTTPAKGKPKKDIAPKKVVQQPKKTTAPAKKANTATTAAGIKKRPPPKQIEPQQKKKVKKVQPEEEEQMEDIENSGEEQEEQPEQEEEVAEENADEYDQANEDEQVDVEDD